MRDKLTGIYKVVTPSGYIYIGQSRNMLERFKHHKKPSSPLGRSILKYGIEGHMFYLIHRLPNSVDQKELDCYEKFYIKLCQDSGCVVLNLTNGGLNGTPVQIVKDKIRNKILGTVASEETRKKLSTAKKGKPSPLKGRKLSKERIEQIRQYGIGRKHSEETKNKMSAWHKGKPKSDFVKQAVAESNKNRELKKKGYLKKDLPKVVKITKGVPHPNQRGFDNGNARVVMHTEYGVFVTLREASIMYGKSEQQLWMELNGRRINKSKFVYADVERRMAV